MTTVMKTTRFVILVSACFAFIHCSKEFDGEEASIVNDCTGSYLRFANGDRKVCNAGMLSNYTTGTAGKVQFTAIDTCADATVDCYVLHNHLGWVRVEQISSR